MKLWHQSVFDVFVGDSPWSGATPQTPTLMCDPNIFEPRHFLGSGSRFVNREMSQDFPRSVIYVNASLKIVVILGRSRVPQKTNKCSKCGTRPTG